MKPTKKKPKNIKKNGHAQAKNGLGIAGLSDGMIKAYQNGSLTQNQIAEQLGVTKTTVGKALKARGIRRQVATGQAIVQSKVYEKDDTSHNSSVSPVEDLPLDFDLDDWIVRAKEGEDVQALQMELDTAFLDILRLDADGLRETSKALSDYVRTGHQMWRSLQGMTAMAMKGMAKGQPPVNSDGSMNYNTVEKLGKLARVIDLMHPNPIQHFTDVVLPQQETLQANSADELPVLRIEAMTPEEVEEIQRQHENASFD